MNLNRPTFFKNLLPAICFFVGLAPVHADAQDGTTSPSGFTNSGGRAVGANQSGSFAASGASAGNTTAPQSPAQAGDGSTVFSTGGVQQYAAAQQSEVYKRANEVNLLQIVYIAKNLEDVDKNLRVMENLSQTTDPGFDNLPTLDVVTNDFCGTTDRSADEQKTCLQEFRALRVQQLRELKESVLANQTTMAQLDNETKSAIGPGAGSATRRAPVYGAKVNNKLFPKIPSYVDLSNDFDLRARAGLLAMPDISSLKKKELHDFASRALSAPDCKRDFFKVQKVLTGAKASGGKAQPIDVAAFDARGNVQIDTDACNKAKLDYGTLTSKLNLTPGKGTQQAIEDLAKKLNDRAENQRKTIATNRGKAAFEALNKNDPGTPKNQQTCDSLKTSGGGPRYYYCVALNLVNEDYNNEDPQTLSKVANRATAGLPGAAATGPAQTEGYRLKTYLTNPDAPTIGPKPTETNDGLYMDSAELDSIMQSRDN